MRRRVLDIVRCPICQAKLESSKVHREEDPDEIIDGELKCGKDHLFPVINGVPRLLPPDLLAETLQIFHSPEKRHNAVGQNSRDYKSRVLSKTLRSFSYQWNVFSEMYAHWEENFKSYFKPLVQMSDFHGKLVLDAGCGFGRHAYYAGKMGAEVVAVDLSEAVEAAYKNTAALSNVHVIQADIYNLPVANCFDLVYCVGVLQHVPDPPGAFGNLAKALKAGAGLFVWVYARRRGIYRLVDLMRKISIHLPMRLLYFLTLFLNVASFLFFSLPYKILSGIPVCRSIANRLPFTRYADLPLRAGHADWFDRLSVPSTVYFSSNEVEQWYRDSEMDEAELVSRDGIGWCAFGKRKTPTAQPESIV